MPYSPKDEKSGERTAFKSNVSRLFSSWLSRHEGQTLADLAAAIFPDMPHRRRHQWVRKAAAVGFPKRTEGQSNYEETQRLHRFLGIEWPAGLWNPECRSFGERVTEVIESLPDGQHYDTPVKHLAWRLREWEYWARRIEKAQPESISETIKKKYPDAWQRLISRLGEEGVRKLIEDKVAGDLRSIHRVVLSCVSAANEKTKPVEAWPSQSSTFLTAFREREPRFYEMWLERLAIPGKAFPEEELEVKIEELLKQNPPAAVAKYLRDAV